MRILFRSIVLVSLMLATFPHALAHAETDIMVTTFADELNADGYCSLREAIQAANTDNAVDACGAGSGADIIHLPAGMYVLRIPGAGEDGNATGDLDIFSDMYINGYGAAVVDGAGLDRVFHVLSGAVGFSGLTIQNGNSDGGSGILNAGTVILDNSIVRSNVSNFGAGGGIASGGNLTLSSSTVSDNTAYSAGGIRNFHGTVTLSSTTVSGNVANTGNGGGIENLFGALTLNNSAVTANTASTGQGGGLYNSFSAIATLTEATIDGNTTGSTGGGVVNEGTMTLNDSTVSGNAASYGSGGGIRNAGTLTLTNATVSGNTASGPLLSGGGISNFGALIVNNSTVSGNSTLGFSASGGGIGNFGTATLNNTVIGNNAGGDCSGNITSAGHNLIEDITGCTIVGDTTGDITDVDPLLGSLAANGGPTQTHALLSGSPAIDAGSPDCPSQDQRGRDRPVDGNGDGVAVCDIGAYEAEEGTTPPPQPALPVGWHEGPFGEALASGCSAYGWTYDPDDIDRDVQVRVLVDDMLEPVATATAGLLGRSQECPDDTCVFSVPLWGRIAPSEVHNIVVQAWDEETRSWIDLSGTGNSLTCIGYPEGSRDYAEGFVTAPACLVGGWVMDPDDPSRDVQVDIYEGDMYLTTTYSTMPSGDSLGESCPDLTCNYEVSIWGQVEPGVELNVWAQALDLETGSWVSLSGPPQPLTCFAEVSPSARFTVFPESDTVQAWDWPLNAVVYMTIDDPTTPNATGPDYGDFATVGPAPWDENQILAFWEVAPYDVKPGDLVTLIYGTTLISYEVEPISLTDVDPVTDTIAGTAQPGETVYVWQHGQDWAIQEPAAGQDGGWEADFRLAVPPFDIAPGASGRAEVRDGAGNATAVDWTAPLLPNAWFTAFPEGEIIEGWDWPLGATVHLSIDDPGAGESPDFELDETVTFTPWGSGQLWVWFEFPGAYDLKPGDIVTLTDGVTERVHVVQDLSITAANADENTVDGTAPPERNVILWSWEDPDAGRLEVNADGLVPWTADFDDVGFDLQLGHHVRAEVWEGGNDTAVDWEVRNPRIAVYLEGDFVIGWDWPHGASVHLTVDDPANGEGTDLERDATVERTPFDPNTWWARFDFAGTYDVKPGDIVVLTDGVTTREHVVLPLTVDAIDGEADTVAGTSDAGASVYVYPWGSWFDPTPADDVGNWLMDFTDLHDLLPGTWGTAEVFDDANNSTAIDWMVPLRIDIRPWSGSNQVLCRASWDLLPVAVFSEDGFDPTAVDHDSVRFGRTGTEAGVVTVHGRPLRYARDVNRDGLLDMVYTFRFGDTGFSCADIPLRQHSARVEATLTGWMGDIHLEGRDSLTLFRLLGH